MYTGLTAEGLAAINSLSRTFRARLTFSNLTIADDIFFIRYQSGANADTALTMGTTTSATVTIETAYLSGVSLKNRWFTLEFAVKVGDDFEYFPVGEFYVRESTRNGDKMTITAADRMSKFDKTYSTYATFPQSAEAVLAEIADTYDFEFDLTGLEDITIPFRPSSKTTIREFIGEIASLAGKNACFDREGVLRFYWYSDNGAEISADYVDEPDVEEQDFVIKFLLYNINAKTSDLYGDENAETGLTIDNEFVLSGGQESVWNTVKNFAYRPASIKQRIGNPLFDNWDIITLTMGSRSYTVLPMGIEIDFDGGIQVAITCTAPEDDKDYKSPAEIAAEKQAAKDENIQLVLTTSNASKVTLTDTDQLLCTLDFATESESLPYVMATVQLSEVTAEVVTLTLMINSQVIQIFNLNAVDGYNLATFVQAFLDLSRGSHNLQLYIRSGGAGIVEAQRGQIVLTGSGLSAMAGWNGILSPTDIYNIVVMRKRSCTVPLVEKSCDLTFIIPDKYSFAEKYTPVKMGNNPVTVHLIDNLSYNYTAANDGYNAIIIDFANPIVASDYIDKSKISITAYRGGVPEVVEVTGVGLEKALAPSILSDLTFAEGKFTATATLTEGTEYTLTFLRKFPSITVDGLENYTVAQLGLYTARQIEGVQYVCALTSGDISETITDYYTFTATAATATIEVGNNLSEIDKDCFVARLEEGASSFYQSSNRLAISTSSLERLDSLISFAIEPCGILSPFDGTQIAVQGSFTLVTATAESEE